MSGLVDTHAHLMDEVFHADREAVVSRAWAAGVSRLVLVGYDVDSSRASIDLARRIPGARAVVGIHPNSAAEASEADFEEIRALAGAPEVVGVGETGLDYYRHHTPPARQRQAFEWHLELAQELGLPVIVHNRQADEDIARLATTHAARERPGVLHCFSSTDPTYLEHMLDAGFYISFAGPLTFKNADITRAMAARVSRDRLLVETDCPYLAPEPHRGRRNEPAFVRETAAHLAEVAGLPFDVMVETLWRNSVRVFPALERDSEVAAA